MTDISVENTSKITVKVGGTVLDLTVEEARSLLGHLKRVLQDTPYWDYAEGVNGKQDSLPREYPGWFRGLKYPYDITCYTTASDVI